MELHTMDLSYTETMKIQLRLRGLCGTGQLTRNPLSYCEPSFIRPGLAKTHTAGLSQPPELAWVS